MNGTILCAGCEMTPLTGRERDVLALLLQGLTNKQIAVALGISGFTARDHVSSLLRKSGARTRVELVIAQMTLGALQPVKSS